MSLRNDMVYVRHILSAIERVHSYTNGMTEAQFMTNTVQDAVVRQFEIIGEASKKVGRSTWTWSGLL